MNGRRGRKEVEEAMNYAMAKAYGGLALKNSPVQEAILSIRIIIPARVSRPKSS